MQTGARKQVDSLINSKTQVARVCQFHVEEKCIQTDSGNHVDYLTNSKTQIAGRCEFRVEEKWE